MYRNYIYKNIDKFINILVLLFPILSILILLNLSSFAGGMFLYASLLIMGIKILDEYSRLLARRGVNLLNAPILLGIFGFSMPLYILKAFPDFFNQISEKINIFIPALFLLIAFGLFTTLFFLKFYYVYNTIIDIPISLFVCLYIAAPILSVVWLMHEMDHMQISGIYWVCIVIIITKIVDVGGWLFGNALGKHPVFRHISSNKTLEGYVGGVVFGGLMTCLTSLYFFKKIMWKFVSISLTLIVGNMVGDICKCMIKKDLRDHEHGPMDLSHGVLDVVDAVAYNMVLLSLLFYSFNF